VSPLEGSIESVVNHEKKAKTLENTPFAANTCTAASI
jgi:hypothetical protein